MEQTFTGSIYLIINKINNKKYVGQTVQDVNVRFAGHCKKSSHCPKLRNAIQKYGKENFKIITLKVFACSDFETLHKQLDYWETWYIEYYHSVEQGYNCTYGGEHFIATEEWKKEASLRWKEYWKTHTPTMTGRRHSPETIEKMKIAAANRSEEYRKKISQSKMGKPNKNCWKPILQYDLDGNLIKEWPSVASANKSFGTSNSHIGNCANGRRKTAYGYVWKYKI